MADLSKPTKEEVKWAINVLKERDEQLKRVYEEQMKAPQENICSMVACTGEIISVPESQLEAFKKRDEELKQAMAEGWKPGTPLPEKYASERAKQHRAWYKEQVEKERKAREILRRAKR